MGLDCDLGIAVDLSFQVPTSQNRDMATLITAQTWVIRQGSSVVLKTEG